MAAVASVSETTVVRRVRWHRARRQRPHSVVITGSFQDCVRGAVLSHLRAVEGGLEAKPRKSM